MCACGILLTDKGLATVGWVGCARSSAFRVVHSDSSGDDSDHDGVHSSGESSKRRSVPLSPKRPSSRQRTAATPGLSDAMAAMDCSEDNPWCVPASGVSSIVTYRGFLAAAKAYGFQIEGTMYQHQPWMQRIRKELENATRSLTDDPATFSVTPPDVGRFYSPSASATLQLVDADGYPFTAYCAQRILSMVPFKKSGKESGTPYDFRPLHVPPTPTGKPYRVMEFDMIAAGLQSLHIGCAILTQLVVDEASLLVVFSGNTRVCRQIRHLFALAQHNPYNLRTRELDSGPADDVKRAFNIQSTATQTSRKILIPDEGLSGVYKDGSWYNERGTELCDLVRSLCEAFQQPDGLVASLTTDAFRSCLPGDWVSEYILQLNGIRSSFDGKKIEQVAHTLKVRRPRAVAPRVALTSR